MQSIKAWVSPIDLKVICKPTLEPKNDLDDPTPAHANKLKSERSIFFIIIIFYLQIMFLRSRKFSRASGLHIVHLS